MRQEAPPPGGVEPLPEVPPRSAEEVLQGEDDPQGQRKPEMAQDLGRSWVAVDLRE